MFMPCIHPIKQCLLPFKYTLVIFKFNSEFRPLVNFTVDLFQYLRVGLSRISLPPITILASGINFKTVALIASFLSFLNVNN